MGKLRNGESVEVSETNKKSLWNVFAGSGHAEGTMHHPLHGFYFIYKISCCVSIPFNDCYFQTVIVIKVDMLACQNLRIVTVLNIQQSIQQIPFMVVIYKRYCSHHFIAFPNFKPLFFYQFIPN